MKKTKLFLAAILVLTVFAMASCSLIIDFMNKPDCTHADDNKDLICDLCGAELEATETPDTHEHNFVEGKCECGETDPNYQPPHEHNFVEGKCECGETDPNYQPPHEHNFVEGKCECGEEDPNYVPPCNHTDADGNFFCDSCGADLIPENMERVSYSLNISDLEAGTRAADEINGKFTIVSGTEVRNRTKTYNGVEYSKSVKMAAGAINVDVPGSGKLSFIVQNGSSGAAVQYVKITAPDGTVSEVEIPGTDEGSPTYLVELEVTPGTWSIQRVSGTIDVFYLDLSCIVEKSDENGFELVSAGKVDYLCGQGIDVTGIKLNATFANGKTEPLPTQNVNIDATAVDMTKPGTYPITLTYKNYAPITVNVNVYSPEEVILHFDAIEKLAQNTSAGNGVYYNHSFKEVYFVGETLDLTGLSVIVKGKLGETSKEFNVGKDYTLSDVDLSTAGEKILTVTYANVSANVRIDVVEIQPTVDPDSGEIKALVDPAYLGIIGELSGPYHVFNTIQQALDFLAKADANTPKVISIAPGHYEEKLEITIPNLTIEGSCENPEDVVIEWNSLYGLVDAGGFTHTTDSTQTVAIRESAHNVTIKNVTISNYWNTQDRMDAAGLAIERGLALLVQADRFTMKNSRLLGIQDTLELFTGRQYFENVFISGYTDFIFGTNNTTYFKGCTIHVIDTVKDDQGTAGYLTAFKGSNKGAADSIVYGAIFDQCKFTADEGVTAGKTAIGRTWGAYAAVAVMNSEIGEHISLDGYDKANNKNKRYISMNGIHPTDSTVQFVEYNNTGAGAVTEAVAGMRFLTAEEAQKYADFAVIFGTINGGVSYLDPWNPESTEIIVDDRDYYYFNGSSSSSGTSHTFDTTTTIASGSTLEWDGLLISAENGKVAWNQNANALNMKAGAFIKFNVKAGTLVTVETYPNYNYFTLNGVATASANMLSQYYAEDTEVILLSTGDLYIYSIIINPGEEAPEAPTLNEIKASGMNVNYTVGTELSLEGLVLKAIYSDNSILTPSDYTVDSSAVNVNEAGEYVITITYGGKTTTVTVTYEDPNAGPEISKDTILDFTTPDGLEAVQSNPKVTITGSVRHNGAEIQIQGTISFPVKAGTLITVIPYANSQYASYTIGMEGEEGLETLNVTATYLATEDCTIVYTGLSNNYLQKILISCPIAEGKYVFGGKEIEGDVTGILSSIQGLTISGTCKNHSGGAQLGQDSKITFTLPAFASVSIQGFDTSYGQLTVKVNGQLIAMDGNACYVFSTTEASLVEITAVNVGTEEAPAYNKSYITSITVAIDEPISENLNVTFGSAGNYKESGIDFSGIQIGDNGGNNSQVKNGSFSFIVKAGAVITINGYPNYTSYSFNGSEEITADTYVYTATADEMITITPVSGNNYFYSISIVYPVVYGENTTIDLSKTGANIQKTTGMYEGLEIDATNGKFADNNGGWVQVNQGTVIKLNVLEGATVSVSAYTSADNFAIAIADGVCTITCVANDYLKAITISYSAGGDGETKEEVTYVLDATTDLAAMDAGAKADGDTQVVADFFTIHYSAKTKIDSSKKNFDDGYSATQRINFGAKTNTSNMNNSIEFTVTDAAKITIWWVSNGDGRQTVIFNANGEVVKTTETSVKNSLYIDSFELEAGTYYIGTADGGSNYTFKVEVETTK